VESTDFIYWLQGALEMNPEMFEKGMSPQQVKTIQDHLNLVFNKVTPDRFQEINIPDPNSSGNRPQQQPGSICEIAPLFCETIDVGTDMAKRAGRRGLKC